MFYVVDIKKGAVARHPLFLCKTGFPENHPDKSKPSCLQVIGAQPVSLNGISGMIPASFLHAADPFLAHLQVFLGGAELLSVVSDKS